MFPFPDASPLEVAPPRAGDGCFLSILARSGVLEEDAEEESLIMAGSCNLLGVDRPDEEFDLESVVFSSVSVVAVVGVKV